LTYDLPPGYFQGGATAMARWELGERAQLARVQAIEQRLFTRLYFSRTPWDEALFNRCCSQVTD